MSIFFYIVGSLLAAAPLIAGIILKIRPPKNINGIYGFRTKLSASSKEAWVYSQKICADGLLIYSIPELLLWGAVLALSIIYLRGYEWLPFVIGFVFAILGVICVTVVTHKKTRKYISDINQETTS